MALVAVLDSAALWMALSPGRAPAVEARLALRMGFTALRSIAETVGLEVDHDPDPDAALQLSYESVAYALMDRLDAVPGPWTGPRATGDTEVAPVRVRPPNRTPTPYPSSEAPEGHS